jgi:aminopeptidase N
MEYPGLVTTWGRKLVPPSCIASDVHDSAVTHEVAHQWFPGVVSSNETAHPWLDEGLAQWLGLQLQRAWYAERWPLCRWLSPAHDDFADMHTLTASTEPPLRSSLLPAYAYDLPHLIEAVYVRPALALEEISKRWGRERLLRALGDYARTQRFASPTPDALFVSFDRVYWSGFSERWLLPALKKETPISE